MLNIGDNIEAEVKGGKLVLSIDLSQSGKESGSGKMLLVCNSGGWQKVVGKGIPDGFKFNLTGGVPNEKTHTL